ncbi:MAG: hypothetical protein KDD82_04270, partial [Planctomycetes bacterium]|nr:hypothetical protein [Planctomycetota bacterium]
QPRALGALVASRLMVGVLVLCGAAALCAIALSPRCPRRGGRFALGVAAVVELGVGVAPAVVTAPVAQVRGAAPTPEAGAVATRVHFTPYLARYAQIERFASLPDYVGWASREALVENTARWRNWEHFRGTDKAFAPWLEQTYLMAEKLPAEPRVRLLAACGVQRLVSNLRPGPGLLHERDLGGGLHRSALREAFPRAFWVPEGRVVDAQAEAARAVFAGGVDLGRVALIPSAAARETLAQAGNAGPPPPDLVPGELPGPRWSATPAACAIRSHTATEVRVDAPGEAGVVVLLDVWFPGWTVEVDGEERPLLRANFAFRGVEVAAQDRELVFRYRPRPLRLGLCFTALGLLALVALSGGGALRRRLAGFGAGRTAPEIGDRKVKSSP